MRTGELDAIVTIIKPHNYHFDSLFIIFSIFDKKSAVRLILDLLRIDSAKIEREFTRLGRSGRRLSPNPANFL